eukprot:CAMPEP_0117449598 /NCGR_PEP_ID=MMETSP0759-20121206/8027_1 /TAXON_ID=63605 /ORGANISM="Percolomonas cosmopolitus, Strain WS" /LENGTH=1202 /DNA_ID=CAMNT_0005242077 /DNA_START=332 /DNA_END=3941 /DNA_ORIENTATION=+
MRHEHRMQQQQQRRYQHQERDEPLYAVEEQQHRMQQQGEAMAQRQQYQRLSPRRTHQESTNSAAGYDKNRTPIRRDLNFHEKQQNHSSQMSPLNLQHLLQSNEENGQQQQNTVVLVLMIEIRSGVYDRILIRQNDNLHHVAQKFRQKHELPMGIVQPLIDYIESNLERKLEEQQQLRRDQGTTGGNRSARRASSRGDLINTPESQPASARSSRLPHTPRASEATPRNKSSREEPDNLELSISDAVSQHRENESSRLNSPRLRTPRSSRRPSPIHNSARHPSPRRAPTPNQHSNRSTPLSSHHTSQSDLDHMNVEIDNNTTVQQQLEIVDEVLPHPDRSRNDGSLSARDGGAPERARENYPSPTSRRRSHTVTLTTRHKIPDLTPFQKSNDVSTSGADSSATDSYETKKWTAKQRILLEEYHAFMERSRKHMETSISNIEQHDARLKRQEQKNQTQDAIIDDLKREMHALRKQCSELQKSSVNCVELISNLRKKTQSQQVIIEGLETDVLDLQKQNLNLMLTRSQGNNSGGGMLPSPVRPTAGISMFAISPTKDRSSTLSTSLRNMTPEVQKYLMSDLDELPRPKSPSSIRSRDLSPPRREDVRVSEQLRDKFSSQSAELEEVKAATTSPVQRNEPTLLNVKQKHTFPSRTMQALAIIAQPDEFKETPVKADDTQPLPVSSVADVKGTTFADIVRSGITTATEGAQASPSSVSSGASPRRESSTVKRQASIVSKSVEEKTSSVSSVSPEKETLEPTEVKEKPPMEVHPVKSIETSPAKEKPAHTSVLSSVSSVIQAKPEEIVPDTRSVVGKTTSTRVQDIPLQVNEERKRETSRVQPQTFVAPMTQQVEIPKTVELIKALQRSASPVNSVQTTFPSVSKQETQPFEEKSPVNKRTDAVPRTKTPKEYAEQLFRKSQSPEISSAVSPTIVAETKTSSFKPKELETLSTRTTPLKKTSVIEEESVVAKKASDTTQQVEQKQLSISPASPKVEKPPSLRDSPPSIQKHGVIKDARKVEQQQEPGSLQSIEQQEQVDLACQQQFEMPVPLPTVEIPEEDNLPLQAALLVAIKKLQIKKKERLAKEYDYEVKLQAERRELNEKLKAQSALRQLADSEGNGQGESLNGTGSERIDYEKQQLPPAVQMTPDSKWLRSPSNPPSALSENEVESLIEKHSIFNRLQEGRGRQTDCDDDQDFSFFDDVMELQQ